MMENDHCDEDELYEKEMEDASHSKTQLAAVKALQQNDDLCDYTLKAGGSQTKVHRVLLAASSDYFRAMFLGSMRESHQNSVELGDMTPQSLQEVINFIYTGKLTLNLENLPSVLNACSHLQVKGALKLCCDYINSLLTFDTADSLLPWAEHYHLDEVTKKFEEVILNDFEEFCDTDNFLDLTTDQLVRYLSSDTLKIKSEYTLFECVYLWLSHDKSRCKQSVIEVFKHIRFSLMNEAELDIVSSKTYKICKTLEIPLDSLRPDIADGQRYHSDLIMGHPIITPKMHPRTSQQNFVMLHHGAASPSSTIEILQVPELRVQPAFCETMISMICRELRAAVLDNFIFIIALVDFGGGALDGKVLRFDPRHCDVEYIPWKYRARMSTAFVAHNNILYTLGGFNQFMSVPVDYCEAFNLRTQQAIEISPMPRPCYLHAAIPIGNKIYITGGRGLAEDPSDCLSTTYSYDITTQRWTQLCPINYARRMHSMHYFQDKLYIMGGISRQGIHAGTLMPIEYYSIETDQWTLLPQDLGTLPSNSVGQFAIANKRIYRLGKQCKESKDNELWVLDMDKGWTLIGELYRQENDKRALYCSNIVPFILPIHVDMNVLNKSSHSH